MLIAATLDMGQQLEMHEKPNARRNKGDLGDMYVLGDNKYGSQFKPTPSVKEALCKFHLFAKKTLQTIAPKVLEDI